MNHGGINAEIRPRGRGRRFNTQGDEFRSFPTALRQAGHYTTLVSPFPQRHGAWHTVDGFDEWIDTGGNDGERAEVVYPHARNWLEDHADEKDWYLHVNFWDPHSPYDMPMDYGDPFEDEPAPAWPDEETIREHYESYGPHSAQELHDYGDGTDHERPPDEIASREDSVQWINGYDTGIRYMDKRIGRLLDQLRDAGVYEETLVVVSADHRKNQGECNVYGDHQTADDKTCRVPLIVSGPGVEPGVDDGLHYQIDLPPTIADIVGGNRPERLDGESFAPALTADEEASREFLVVSQGAWACQRGVRWDDWLLIRSYYDGLKDFDPVELYDLAADPHETTNLARERHEVARTGLTKLEQWTSSRLLEAATDEAGGNASAPRGVTGPLWEVVREGGPFHAKADQQIDSYADRLRETDREAHARKLETHRGIVPQDVEAYLDDESVW